MSRFGLAVKRLACRQDLGSIPFRLSFFFKKVVVCGHCLVTLSLTINEHQNGCPSECRSHSGGDSVALGIVSLSLTSWDLGPRHYLFGNSSALNKCKQAGRARPQGRVG